jgi:hypothetical protein
MRLGEIPIHEPDFGRDGIVCRAVSNLVVEGLAFLRRRFEDFEKRVTTQIAPVFILGRVVSS